jgi:ketosteroid isomerase-like protein
VSQENVEIVMNVHPRPDMDMAGLFRNDAMWSELVNPLAPLFHPAFETVLGPDALGADKVYIGLHGLREAWLRWTEPWLTYRTETVQALDAGDRVLVLAHDYGRREEVSEEVRIDSSGVWTVRDGKIARAEFFAHRSEAFKAAGLLE